MVWGFSFVFVFPSLFALTVDKEESVADVWDSLAEGGWGGWNPCFLRAFNDWEIEEASSFMERVTSCLDEVVIVLPSQTLEQQEQHRWRLCREELFLLTVLLYAPTKKSEPGMRLQIMSGIDQLGAPSVPAPSEAAGNAVNRPPLHKTALPIKNGTFLPHSSPSRSPSANRCDKAAKVEARRVDVVKSHGLLNKSDCFLSSYSLGASMELLIIALSDSSLIRQGFVVSSPRSQTITLTPGIN
ncbi:hypothetical protein CK203_018746 [Vitis vinifera]|uniref:Uncharacterized protein n=1 Tax=Vitis vinifera TaxID=29760 RepID=A0A438JAY1_VITVI|nr:hypothetical protein CK203_018746 [Vitis vinifera]